MDWQREYQSKLVSAEEAVRVVKSGDRVCIPPPVQPRLLPGALWERRNELERVEMHLEAPAIPLPWLIEEGWEQKFPSTFGIFVGASNRMATDEGRADFLPLLFSSHFKRWDEGLPGPIDVLMVVLSPPDEEIPQAVEKVAPELRQDYERALREIDPHWRRILEQLMAALFGRPMRRRAEELIAIAHPDFRGELRKAARERFYATP